MAVETPPRITETKPSTAVQPGTGQPWQERWGGLFFVAPFLLLFALFMLWPIVSGLWNSFFNTSLDILLRYIQAETLIITGMAGNICVLFTANDAYMRDFRLLVPADCTASSDPDANKQAVELMARHLKADTTPSEQLDLEALRRERR